jgi:ATP-binding cassette subfamily C (CFTR/MRP) protein 4
MIGELENYSGRVSIGGKIYYISQQSWIFPATLRQNIIFGNPYDKEKFDKVVEACSLKKVRVFFSNL